MILVTHQVPDFTASAVLSDGEIIHNFHLKSFIQNKSAVIFFWPMDFTFVCPTEIISFNKRYNDFNSRGVKIVGISYDSVFVHSAWRKTSPDNGGIGNIQYPMVSDTKREIIRAYGVEHPDIGVALRGSFLVDKEGIIRHQVVNDLPLGRSIDEMLRMIDAMHFNQQYGEVCPAQWQVGQDGMVATASGVAKYLSKNLNKL